MTSADSELNGLKTQLEEMRSQMDALLVRAPHAGKVIARRLKSLQGSFVDRGQELAVIGSEDKKRVKLSLSNWEASRIDHWKASPIRLVVPGQPSWKEQLTRAESRASDKPADPSLIVTGGGPISVVKKPGRDEPVLVSPRVNAFIELGPERSQHLRSGQRCNAYVSCWRQSLGGYILDELYQSIRLPQ